MTKDLLPMAADAPTERMLVAETLVSTPPSHVYKFLTGAGQNCTPTSRRPGLAYSML